ncbi:hypothetical protein GLOTRDRAFT_132170 [Gloeophyllum trabeum ATCC 11539]|uniref:Uncharacterized protein n=1 Tax=Gloeophyllum trabeum (strain ATCC 11539 / FP-39264 / Madison 617) TaxID=670483 RepID=S7PX36_GLOTA|nr:uncharacterized protein GLOTRDRAFT_132170 [Gloeophyllum trabeum ATCC 11539]EPQ52048.1 hypothetical protein GLOTRDRAFT_132170 [Gloeophyllum trabeum ATCC 11539]
MSSDVPKSKSAVFSGYLMSPDKFKEFVYSLPVARPWEDEEYYGDPYEAIIGEYSYWRRHVDPKKKKYLPMIRARFAESGDEPGVTRDRITHLLFATRYVPYKGPSQMSVSHPNSLPLLTETERDRALFNVFKQTGE